MFRRDRRRPMILDVALHARILQRECTVFAPAPAPDLVLVEILAKLEQR
jgi:hypothetical protein